MTGKTIGKYRIVGQLGRGGMGTVYKAVDETLDREVAIKVLNPELADTDIMKRFRAEATTLAKLNHPEIATIYELFRSDTDLLMVMELVRGETLDKIADRLGALPPERAAYFIDKILSALEHAHRAGIVHCDIKPANVMVTEHGGVKIMDFGTARVRGTEHADGGMIGTPAYMPPEQVLGQEVDGRADLYAVGVVFYRLLTGAVPFQADTAIDIVQKLISDTPTPLHQHRQGLPDWCETIVQHALAKSPTDRFQTAAEFRETLGKASGMVTLDAAGTPLAVSSATVWGRNAEDATIVLPTRPLAPVGSMLAILAGGITLLAGVVLLGPGVAPATTTANVRPPAIQNATPSTPPPAGGSSHASATGQQIVPAAPSVGATAAQASAAMPPVTATSSAPTGPVEPAGKTFAVPVVFEARALVSDGDRPRERECQVVLADGKINVQANDDHDLLDAVPYDGVLSISYSRGRDPLWNAPEGPRRVARAGRDALGIFRGERHWVSLRTRNADARFVVLRLGNDSQAKRAIIALEDRTGRKADIVAERQDDK